MRAKFLLHADHFHPATGATYHKTNAAVWVSGKATKLPSTLPKIGWLWTYSGVQESQRMGHFI